MGSFFSNPLMLTAMALVGLPWLIEWLFRRRKRQIDLPTIRFLLNNEEEKKIRRQDRMLLILRSIAVFFLVLAISRPLLQKGMIGDTGKRDVVVLIDGTASMNQQVGVTTAFGLAQKRAASLVRELPEESRVSVAHFSSRPQVLVNKETDVYTAAARLESLRPGLGSCPVGDALAMLKKFITDEKLENPEVYIFSDFQKNSWVPPGGKTADAAKSFADIERDCKVFLVDVGAEMDFNFMVTQLRPQDYVLSTEMPVTFHVEVEIWGTPPDDSKPTLSFLVDGIKKGLRDLDPKKEKQILKFDHQFLNAGEHLVEVELEGDRHQIDNKRAYLCSVPASFKVLILDETHVAAGSTGNALAALPGEADTSASDLKKESSFIAKAVEPPSYPGMAKVSRFSSKIINPTRISYENLENYPVIILTQISALDETLAANLKQYVLQGGSLWVFLGPDVNVYDYNKLLYEEGNGILPCKLEEKVSAKDGDGPPVVRYGVSAHPALAQVSQNVNEDSKVLEYMSVKPHPESRVVLNLTNKIPLYIEKDSGSGKVLLSTTTAGISWSYVPATMEFPILVQEMVRYLVGNPDKGVNLQTGEVFKQPIYISTRHMLLKTPAGNKVRVTPHEINEENDEYELRFEDTVQHGVYQVVDTPPEVLARRRFVVNQRSNESNLKKLDKGDFENAFGGGGWMWCGPDRPIEEIVSKLYSVTELAPWIFWFLVITITVESFLAARYGSRRRADEKKSLEEGESGQ